MKKANLGHSKYNFNAWMYHSEYTFHAHAWWGLHWAYGKGIPVLSDLAESARVASVEVNDPTYDLYHDKEFGWLRMIFYLIEGVLGL